MLLGNQVNLPFPWDQMIGSNILENPGQHAFVLPPATPEATHYLQNIAAGLAMLIQTGAKNGYISCFAFNLFSHNRWSNEAFMAIVSDTFDFATKLQGCNPNATPDAVLNTAIRKYHAYAVGNCINHFPALAQVIPMQMANSAITTVNNFRNEQQQLELQYTNVQRQMEQAGMLNIGIGQTNPAINIGMQPSAGVIGGLAAFGSSINIMQENIPGDDGWGNRRRPSADNPNNPTVKPLPVEEPVTIQTMQSAVAVNSAGETYQSLTPRRRRAAAQDDISQLSEQAKALPDETVTEADIFVGESTPLPERPQLQARVEPVAPPAVVERPQFKAREIVIPLQLRNLPDTPEEAADAITADSNFRNLERDLPCQVEAFHIGEAGEDGKEPFGIYTTDSGHLATVVTANDRGWAPSMDQPVRVLYNPFKWHRLLLQRVTADNTVFGPLIEGFMEIKEGDPMDYFDLELDPVERAKALAALDRDKEYIPLTGEVMEIKAVDRYLLPVGLHHSVEKLDRPGLDDEKICVRDSVPMFGNFALQSRRQRKDVTLACVELYNAITSGVKYTGGTVPAGVIIRGRSYEKVQRLNEKPSGRPTRYLRTQILELMSVQPAMAKRVDRLIAADINNVLLYGFGYEEVEIVSFVSDYNDLIDHLLGVYDESTVALLESGFDDKLKRWTISDDGSEIAVDGDALAIAINCPLEETGFNMLSTSMAILDIGNWPLLLEMIHNGQKGEGRDVNHPELWFCGSDGELWQAHPSVFDPDRLLMIRY